MRIAIPLLLLCALELGAQTPPTARGVRAGSGARAGTPAAAAARDSAARAAAPAAPATPIANPADTPVPAGSSANALAPVVATGVRIAPTGRVIANVQPGATLEPIARERGWVRVRLEGWVQEKDLAPAGADLGSQVAAADLRAQGDAARGRVVRWTVQVLALQTADALRRDLAPDETYLLARGPDQEQALLYLVLTPALLETARSIPALTDAVITARVRTGKSNPAGVPVLELTSLSRK